MPYIHGTFKSAKMIQIFLVVIPVLLYIHYAKSQEIDKEKKNEWNYFTNGLPILQYSSKHKRTKRSESKQTMTALNLINRCVFKSQSNCAILSNISAFSLQLPTLEQAFRLFVSSRKEIYEVRYGQNNSCNCALFFSHVHIIQHLILWDNVLYWMDAYSKNQLYRKSISEPRLANPIKVEVKQEMSNSQMHYIGCKMFRGALSSPRASLTTETFMKLSIVNLLETSDSHKFREIVCKYQDSPEITTILIYAESNELQNTHTNKAFCFSDKACDYKIVGRDSSGANEVVIDNLQPGSSYYIGTILLQNTGKFVSGLVSKSTEIETICRVPLAAIDISCRPMTDSQILLEWRAPPNTTEDILYDVLINDKPYKINFVETSIVYENSVQSDYYFKIGTKTVSCPDKSNNTQMVTCNFFMAPSIPEVDSTSPRSITLYWQPPRDNSSKSVVLKWRHVQATKWLSSERLDGTIEQIYPVTDLIQNSGYEFKAQQQYTYGQWKDSAIGRAQTSHGEPSFPKNVTAYRENEQFFLLWEQPNAFGSPIINYAVEYRNRTSPEATRLVYGKWTMADKYVNGKTLQWEIKDLTLGEWYEFRVSAVNAIGEGDKSQPSSPLHYALSESEGFTEWFIIGICGGLILLLFSVIMFIVVCRHKKSRKRAMERTPEITTIHLSYGTDLQLAQIRHMAELSNFQGVPDLPNDYMELLPLFPRDRLTLKELLGRGAFGEVYSGIADFGDDNEGEERVAVKTLREGSTDAEKCEFLMEAYFMSLFHHKNILSLRGVCIDNEPQYLILELMEGGDLLRYLREARPNPLAGPKLSLEDLIEICLDIACGCKYLEEQHFVHRDLATRNCLVSTRAYCTRERVVKIGDFGLARDIYKNDYYLKEGEGLLPVRWMAPESLVDNIYTVQTDMWAFGVIIWEVMTYGQQPYPARNNVEVLQFVRGGGRLEKPQSCPEDIYALMRKCWHNTPSLRPSFTWAVQWLQDFLVRYPAYKAAEDERENETTYLTVGSSNDGASDDGSQGSPVLQRSEQRFTAAAFQNPAFLSDDLERPSIEGSTGTSGNDSFNYFKLLKDDETKKDEHMLNYSILGFPPSRNQSTKNSITSPRMLPTRSKPLGAESEETMSNYMVKQRPRPNAFRDRVIESNSVIEEEVSDLSLEEQDFPVFSDYFKADPTSLQMSDFDNFNSYSKFSPNKTPSSQLPRHISPSNSSAMTSPFPSMASIQHSVIYTTDDTGSETTCFDEPWVDNSSCDKSGQIKRLSRDLTLTNINDNLFNNGHEIKGESIHRKRQRKKQTAAPTHIAYV